MRISVNLATRPFVELRPFFLRLRIAMAVLALAVVALAIANHVLAAKLHREQDDVAQVHNAIVGTQQEKNGAEASMHQPANAAVLERAQFLNALFLRKSFSWTAVMMDLENVLPSGVQVTSIEPSVTPAGDVQIRLRVSGDRDRAVQLVRNLERSQRFLHPRLSGESTQAKETGTAVAAAPAPGVPAGVEFDILADYNPLPVNEAFHYPRPRLEATAEPFPNVPAQSVIAPRPLPARPRRRSGQYPRDGVVLRPYAAAGPQAATGQSVIAPQPRPGGTR